MNGNKDMKNNRFYNDEQLKIRLHLFRDFLLDYNKHTNLTAITNFDEFDQKHLVDALEIFELDNLKNRDILDIGSGGGIPGLVLAIAEPTCNITMVDSNNKKTSFLKQAVTFLNLENVKVINDRIENLKDELTMHFDLVTARAVAPTNILLELGAFACKINGKIILYKGSNALEELPSKKEILLKELGIKFSNQFTYYLEDNIARNLIVFKKFQDTKEKYPRNYSQIKKMPLYKTSN